MKILKIIHIILKKKIKINFSKPFKKKILVFDGESINDLKFILENHDYTIIECRENRLKEINFSFKLIFYSLVYFINIIFLHKLNIVYLYYYTLIKLINPRIIITTIDNSTQLHQLAKVMNKSYFFIFIQNARRLDYESENYKFKNKITNININSKVFIPNYFCFGNEEEKSAKKYNLNIAKFYKYGSIRVANYLEYIKRNELKIKKDKYDIALISEPAVRLNKKFKRKFLEEGFAEIAKFTIKFSTENNLKFIFLSKRYKNYVGENSELEFYKNYLNKQEFKYLLDNVNEKKDEYSSYHALFQSSVAIGCQSTLLLDKIGRKEKILSCNLTRFELYDFPINDICSLNDCNYEQFSSRLKKIKDISTTEYFKHIDTSDVMAYDPNESLIKKIRKFL